MLPTLRIHKRRIPRFPQNRQRAVHYRLVVENFHGNSVSKKNRGCDSFLAEGERFELSIPCGIHAFQACALGHYATLPYFGDGRIADIILPCNSTIQNISTLSSLAVAPPG